MQFPVIGLKSEGDSDHAADRHDLLALRPWIALSIGCSLFALYEGITKLVEGHEIEGILDLLLLIVLVVNYANRFKALARYVDKLIN